MLEGTSMGAWVAQAVMPLTWAQVMILGSWDLPASMGNLLVPLPLPFPMFMHLQSLSLSLSQIKQKENLKKKKCFATIDSVHSDITVQEPIPTKIIHPGTKPDACLYF